MTFCAVDWCDRKVRSLGYCNAHYQRARRGVDLNAPHYQAEIYAEICAAEGCERKQLVRGYCSGHYARLLDGREIDGPLNIVDPGRVCCVGDCGRKHAAKGYCDLHWQRASGKINKPLDAPPRVGIHGDCTLANAHARVRAAWGSASNYSCIACGRPAYDWAYDGTDPKEEYGPTKPHDPESKSLARYSRWPEFYMPMCRKCHLGMDKSRAAEELREYREWTHRTGKTLKDLE